MIKLSDYVLRQLRDWGTRHVFLVTGGGAMHLNDSIGATEGSTTSAPTTSRPPPWPPRAMPASPTPPGPQHHHRPRQHQRAKRRLRRLDRLDSHADRLRPGQARDLHGDLRHHQHAAARRPGSRHRPHGQGHHQVLRLGRRPGPPSPITSNAPGTWRSTAVPAPAGSISPSMCSPPRSIETNLKHYDPSEDALLWDPATVTAAGRRHPQPHPQRRAARASLPAPASGSPAHSPEFEQVIRQPANPRRHRVDARPDRLRRRALLRASGHDRRARRELHRAELRRPAGHGSRLNIRQTSYNWASFARFATKIQVDVDAAELVKPRYKPDIGIHCDVKVFLTEMLRQLDAQPVRTQPQTRLLARAACKSVRPSIPVVQEKQKTAGPPLNPYHFIDQLFALLRRKDVVVCGNATACIVPYQAGKLKKGQRLISNSGSASMGYDLPASIGVAVAKGSRVICLAGDGSLQMNVQELQTVVCNHLPVKDLRPEQRRIPLHPSDPDRLLSGTPHRHRSHQRRHFPRHGQSRRGLRNSVVPD